MSLPVLVPLLPACFCGESNVDPSVCVSVDQSCVCCLLLQVDGCYDINLLSLT